MANFDDVIKDPDYQALKPEEQFNVRHSWFQQKVAVDPDFQALKPEDRVQVGKSVLFPEDKGPTTFQKLVAGPVGAAVESTANLARSVGGAPEAASVEGITSSYKHSREQLDQPLKDIFGQAGEGVSDVVGKARSVGGAVTAPFIPRFVQEGVGPAAEYAGKGYGELARLLGVPESVARTVESLTPDALMLLAGKAGEGAFPRGGETVAPRRFTAKPVDEVIGRNPAFVDETIRNQTERGNAIDQQLTEAERLRQSPRGRLGLLEDLIKQQRDNPLPPEPVETAARETSVSPAARSRTTSLLSAAEEQLRPKAPTETSRTLEAASETMAGRESASALVERAGQRGMIALKIDEIVSDPDYQRLSPEDQASVKQAYVEQVLSKDPEYTAADINGKAAAEKAVRDAEPRAAEASATEAPDLSALSITDLVKKGFEPETGAVGKLSPEQAAAERSARAARREIYRRVSEEASKTGETIMEVGKRFGLNPNTLNRLQAEHGQAQPAGAQVGARGLRPDALEAAAKKIEAEPSVGTQKQIGNTVIDAPARSEVEQAKSALQEAADPQSHFGRLKALYSGTLEESGTTVSKLGETGQRLAQTLRAVRDDAEREAGTAVADLKRNLSGLSQPEKENLVEVLDKGATPMSSNVARAAARERAKLDAIATRATDAGLEIRNPATGEKVPFHPRENFFPHSMKQSFEEMARDPKARAKAVEAIQKQEGIPADEAGRIFDAMVKNSRGRYGHLEVARVYDLGEYDKNPLTALSNYYSRGLRRIHEAEQLGPNNEHAYQAAEQIGQQYGDRARDFAKTLVDRMTGRDTLGLGGRIASDIGGTVKGFEAATKLGQAVIANSSQTALTAVVAGVKNTARAIRAAMTKEGQEFALKSGATLSSALHDFLKEAAGAGGRSLGERAGEKVLKYTGFSAVERANRAVAANAGRFFAQDAFEKVLAAPKSRSSVARSVALRRMGVDVDAALTRGELSETDLLKAGQSIVERTQFKTEAVDLPLFWTSPFGRIVTQFKSFAFRSGKMLKDDVLTPALDYTRTGGRRGSLGPILRAATILPIVGEGVEDVRSAIRGKQRPDNLFARIAEDYAAVGTLGLFSDTWRAASFGKGGVLGLIAGPAVSDVAELGTGAIQAVQGEPKTLAKFATRNIPVVGQSLAGRLFQRKQALRPELRERVGRGDLRR